MCQKKGNIPRSNYAITTHRLRLHDLCESRVIASYRTIITLGSVHVYKMGAVWWPLGIYTSQKMVLSSYQKQRLLHYYFLGKHSTSIARLLREEGIVVNRSSVYKFINKFKETESITRRPGSGRPTKITPEILHIVENQMELDDETTAVQLQGLLVEAGHPLSLKTILRSRSQLGWTFRGSAYCQLIREANKQKRLDWARTYFEKAANDGFEDVVWTDESSIQLETHRRRCYRKEGCQARPKPR